MKILLTDSQVGGLHDLGTDPEEAQFESYADDVGEITRQIREIQLLLGVKPSWP